MKMTYDYNLYMNIDSYTDCEKKILELGVDYRKSPVLNTEYCAVNIKFDDDKIGQFNNFLKLNFLKQVSNKVNNIIFIKYANINASNNEKTLAQIIRSSKEKPLIEVFDDFTKITFHSIVFNLYKHLIQCINKKKLILTDYSTSNFESNKFFGGRGYISTHEIDYDYAPFLKISDTKTISGIKEGEYKFDGKDLQVIKKRLGNFKHFQTNLIGGQSFIFAKKSFLAFIEKYDLKGLNFKPVKIMSLTGDSKDSQSVFWAIPQLDYKEDITVSGYRASDKFRQNLPLTLKRKYQEEMSQVDFFDARALFGTCLSQRAYQALHLENMKDDIVGVTYCDIGLYSSEPTKKLKEKLIANNCFDFELEEKFGEL